MVETSLENPILNRPFDPPSRHFEIGSRGPTGVIRDGRRPSESFIPLPPQRKNRQASQQLTFDLDGTGERRERNDFINQLRQSVEIWRDRGYPRVTPISRKLLVHWADPGRENRVLFCQREAAETAIYLAEVAGRDEGNLDLRRRLEAVNAEHNGGLPRIALKMATGSGKTVVMAMLIAWQTLNKVASPHDARFASSFLVVAPGITIRDRLGVLQPSRKDNYYDARDLIPIDLRPQLGRARIVVTNYHTFIPRATNEMRNVSAKTKQVLVNGGPDRFVESEKQVVSRVLRGLGSRPGEIVVLNDEAHHCYRDRPFASATKLDRDEQAENESARVWFQGLRAIQRHIGVKSVFDLSATPFYLRASGYAEGYIFPWTVSDFSLMDAIESGIVKVPRIPVDDDARSDQVTYLQLWDHIDGELPRRATTRIDSATWTPPKELEGALKSLYASYMVSFRRWEEAAIGDPPPVMIVVCSNTVTSKLVYDWIAGLEIDGEGGPVHRAGNLEAFSNVVDGRPLAKPRTVVVDSVQLESGLAMRPEFKEAAADEIAAFKREYLVQNPGADEDAVTDEDLLREVMNTVGRRGRLGEGIRCVVSVSMLTEGWDANTVTHILGVRPFRSQLLCEQVVGRGLRRRSYDLDDDGYFAAEYSNVYGIPFAFIPSNGNVGPSIPALPPLEVASVPGRENLRISFPHVAGYRMEIPDEDLHLDENALRSFVVSPDTVPNWAHLEGIVGAGERARVDHGATRDQEVRYALTRRLLDQHFSPDGQRPWLFPRLLDIVGQWMESSVRYDGGLGVGHLAASAERLADAVAAIANAISIQAGNRRERLRPVLRRFDPVGSTADIRFVTRKAHYPTTKSEVEYVTFDGPGGNTWEQILALECELSSKVAAYVKNDHLGFSIPYVHKGRTHNYLPDFLVRLARRVDDPVTRTLIVETSGGQKDRDQTAEKARTARDTWCTAVNNVGRFGRWGYIEITTMQDVTGQLDAAIERLYDDSPIIGESDTSDFASTNAGAMQERGIPDDAA